MSKDPMITPAVDTPHFPWTGYVCPEDRRSLRWRTVRDVLVVVGLLLVWRVVVTE